MWAGWRQHRVGELLEILGEGGFAPEEGFRRVSVAEGSKGPRLYDWARLALNPPIQEGFERWLLVRRSIEEHAELMAYTVFAPKGAALEELAKAAGGRWQVEIGFEKAKGEVGLSHYQVRSWHGWYRHIALALFAHALLAALRSAYLDVRRRTEKGGRKGPPAARNSGGSEDSRAVDGSRDPQAFTSTGSGPVASTLGRVALVVGVAS